MTVTPQVEPSTGTLHAEKQRDERPRYAAQRMVAAHMGRLPKRIVVRAQTEGLAHRRGEDPAEE
jgi:hypothetical protein